MNYSKPALITLLLSIAISTSACSTTRAKVESSKPAETTAMKSDDRSKESAEKEKSAKDAVHNEADHKDGGAIKKIRSLISTSLSRKVITTKSSWGLRLQQK